MLDDFSNVFIILKRKTIDSFLSKRTKKKKRIKGTCILLSISTCRIILNFLILLVRFLNKKNISIYRIILNFLILLVHF